MKNIVVLIIVCTSLFSCQKVIDVDLNEANPKLIIEANYTAEDSTVRVKITYTSNYFSNEESAKIDDAVVTITNQSGTSQNLMSQGDGEYLLENYSPQFGTTYTMTVVKDGITYSADSYLAPTVQQDDVIFEYMEEGFFGSDPGYLAILSFLDPESTSDYYMAVVSKNDTVRGTLDQLILQDDLFTNGNYIQRPLFNEFFEIGDSVGIELRTINKKVYDYYLEVQSLYVNQESGAPGNPEYYWSNDALGYFSAYGVSRKGAVVN